MLYVCAYLFNGRILLKLTFDWFKQKYIPLFSYIRYNVVLLKHMHFFLSCQNHQRFKWLFFLLFFPYLALQIFGFGRSRWTITQKNAHYNNSCEMWVWLRLIRCKVYSQFHKILRVPSVYFVLFLARPKWQDLISYGKTCRSHKKYFFIYHWKDACCKTI